MLKHTDRQSTNNRCSTATLTTTTTATTTTTTTTTHHAIYPFPRTTNAQQQASNEGRITGQGQEGLKGGDGKSKGSKEVGGASGKGQLGGTKGNKYVLFHFLFSFVLLTDEITSLEQKT